MADSQLPVHRRLGARVAAGFAAVTVLAVALAGGVIYQAEKDALQDTLGALLLSIARTGARLVDPDLHVEVQITRDAESEAFRWLRGVLAGVQDDNQLETPIVTLADFEPETRRARYIVTSRGPARPGDVYELVPVVWEALERAFRDGVASQTRVYRNPRGAWITGFAPVKDRSGTTIAVLEVDYRVDVYLARLARLRALVGGAALLGAAVAVGVGLVLARRVTGPVSALTRGVARVARGDLSQALPLASRDEVGELTRAFNEMLEGLRQRDFIRDTFGRYVSPEVAETLLASPEGLRLGGEKRDVTVLMSDLRGYTRFVEQGDPEVVVRVLNRYLARMTDTIAEHWGTINEFVGDGIVAFFGAPLPAPDHAARAAACALAMLDAIEEVNARHEAEGLPRLEMGIGLNSGEAIVGNVGSEKRAKYTAVGTTINLAARVEACTVGGQALLSPHTYARVRDVAEVGPPIPVEVKGLREPLLLYELHGLAGRPARLRREREGSGEAEAPVSLPLACWRVEGKAVSPERLAGTVTRLGTRRLEARLAVPLPPLTNVRLRVAFPALGQESADVYGKVLECRPAAGGADVRIALTSVDTADQQVLEGLARPAGPPPETPGPAAQAGAPGPR
jgi:class 3 adenylate cyclase